MIDKIVISVNDDGAWVMNAGDMVHGQYQTPVALLSAVRQHLDKLAFFPGPHVQLPVGPVPFSQLPLPTARRKNRDTKMGIKAQLLAEKHMQDLLSNENMT